VGKSGFYDVKNAHIGFLYIVYILDAESKNIFLNRKELDALIPAQQWRLNI
jgi:hypothetical protein